MKVRAGDFVTAVVRSDLFPEYTLAGIAHENVSGKVSVGYHNLSGPTVTVTSVLEREKLVPDKPGFYIARDEADSSDPSEVSVIYVLQHYEGELEWYVIPRDREWVAEGEEAREYVDEAITDQGGLVRLLPEGDK